MATSSVARCAISCMILHVTYQNHNLTKVSEKVINIAKSFMHVRLEGVKGITHQGETLREYKNYM